MKRLGMVAVVALLSSCQATPGGPDWRETFHYKVESLQPIEIRQMGFPFITVELGGDTVWLPFDTGNMVGLTLESAVFHRLALACSSKWDRLDSGGNPISTGCIAHGQNVTVFGAMHDSISIYEFSHERLPGLVGPGMLPGSRFTMDYEMGVMAVDGGTGPEVVPGFVSLPLVRSPRHPRLILVQGKVRGHDVLIEIDTGKSRTTIDRELVGVLDLERTPDGVRIGRIELGPREPSVSSARIVDTSGISEGLPMPISLGIGSDILAGFVFTVDYGARRLWIQDPTWKGKK